MSNPISSFPSEDDNSPDESAPVTYSYFFYPPYTTRDLNPKSAFTALTGGYRIIEPGSKEEKKEKKGIKYRPATVEMPAAFFDLETELPEGMNRYAPREGYADRLWDFLLLIKELQYQEEDKAQDDSEIGQHARIALQRQLITDWNQKASSSSIPLVLPVGFELEDLSLDGINLENIIAPEITIIECSLIAANLSGARIPDALIVGCDLSQVKAAGADMPGLNNYEIPIDSTLHASFGNNKKIIAMGADFRGANLTEADLAYALLHLAELGSANLTAAKLIATDLRYAKLKYANVKDTIVEQTDLEGANLEGVNLLDAKINMPTVFMLDANLSNTNLAGIYLKEQDLRRVNLQNVDMEGAILIDAILERANLKGANLQNTALGNAFLHMVSLQEANLQQADLGGAWLRYANLKGADLRDANFHGANLQRAFMIGAYNVSLEQLMQAGALDQETQFPHILTFRGQEITGLTSEHILTMYEACNNALRAEQQEQEVEAKDVIVQTRAASRTSPDDILREVIASQLVELGFN